MISLDQLRLNINALLNLKNEEKKNQHKTLNINEFYFNINSFAHDIYPQIKNDICAHIKLSIRESIIFIGSSNNCDSASFDMQTVGYYLIVSNYGNIFYGTVKSFVKDSEWKCDSIVHNRIENNFELDPFIINIIQNFPCDFDTPLIMDMIIKTSKEHTFELYQKYKNLVEENARMKKELDSIPIEYQCCICLSFTAKKQICVPCGHAQYCEDCIVKIKNCSICKKEIDKVIRIFI